MSKVVHLSNEAHAVAKVFCKENGLKMSDWVASLITRAIVADTPSEPEVAPAPAPVQVQATDVPVEEVPTGPKKKKLARFDETEGDEELPAYSKPPFWAKPSAPQELPASEAESGDESVEEPSADADFGGMNSESFGISLPDSFSSPEG